MYEGQTDRKTDRILETEKQIEAKDNKKSEAK